MMTPLKLLASIEKAANLSTANCCHHNAYHVDCFHLEDSKFSLLFLWP